jgi:hypothetical protein
MDNPHTLQRGDVNGSVYLPRPIGAPNLGNRCVGAYAVRITRVSGHACPLGSDPTAKGLPAAAFAIKAVADHCARRLNSCAGIEADGAGSYACRLSSCVGINGQHYLSHGRARIFSPRSHRCHQCQCYTHDLAHDEAAPLDEENCQRPRVPRPAGDTARTLRRGGTLRVPASCLHPRNRISLLDRMRRRCRLLPPH